jgi:hypothetical protein
LGQKFYYKKILLKFMKTLISLTPGLKDTKINNLTNFLILHDFPINKDNMKYLM